MVMAEARSRIDFRDPRTLRLQHSLQVGRAGVNHADHGRPAVLPGDV
jgi:hypothetical protein